LIYLGLAPFVVIAIFPVYWMAITAFKEDADLYRMDLVPFWFHLAPTLQHFRHLIRHTYFSGWFLNTMSLSVCLVLVTLVTAVPAAYALARLRLPGASNLGVAMFMTYLVPPIIIFLPLARVVGTLGLFDSWWALVVVYPTFTIPFCTWLLMGFFRSLPREIEEAAWLDGCGLVGGILRVVLPLARPGIAIAAIFAFTLAMQESLYAVVYVARSDDADGRPGDLADPRRHLLLGLVDGGGARGRPAGGHPVHRVPRSLHPRPHRERRQLTQPRARPADQR
jgi:multiple sugar transport system permease protein